MPDVAIHDSNNVATVIVVSSVDLTSPVKLKAHPTRRRLMLETTQIPSSSAAVTQVADSASVQTLLAANDNRTGASIQNNSSEALYVKLGSTATASDFTIKLFQDDYFEVPYGYTGIITGIWANNSSGQAQVTEFT